MNKINKRTMLAASLALGSTVLKLRTTSPIECPSLKQGITTAILRRGSDNELAAGSLCAGIWFSMPSLESTLMY